MQRKNLHKFLRLSYFMLPILSLGCTQKKIVLKTQELKFAPTNSTQNNDVTKEITKNTENIKVKKKIQLRKTALQKPKQKIQPKTTPKSKVVRKKAQIKHIKSSLLDQNIAEFSKEYLSNPVRLEKKNSIKIAALDAFSDLGLQEKLSGGTLTVNDYQKFAEEFIKQPPLLVHKPDLIQNQEEIKIIEKTTEETSEKVKLISQSKPITQKKQAPVTIVEKKSIQKPSPMITQEARKVLKTKPHSNDSVEVAYIQPKKVQNFSESPKYKKKKLTKKRTQQKHKYQKRLKPINDRYNGTIWVGTRFDYTPTDLKTFIKQPMLGVQVGVAKSVWNISPFTFFYGTLIFNYGYSSEDPGSNRLNNTFHSWYYYINEEFLLGYEQSLWDPHFSLFAEAGGVFQQGNFGIQERSTSNIIDYLVFHTVGGSFNLGFNINLAPRNALSYIVRVGMNATIGPSETRFLSFNNQTLNANPITFGPVLSLAIRK